MFLRNPKVILIGAGLLLLQGCVTGTTPQSRFYRMDSLLDLNSTPEIQLKEHQFLLGVGPVKLADYLNRPQMIARSHANQLKVEEFERWSGSLQDNLEIVLSENLQAQLGSSKVITYPWPRAVTPDYHVTLKVLRFDAQDQEVILRTSWLVLDKAQSSVLDMRTVEIREQAADKSPAALVSAQSRTLEALSMKLVSTLDQILKQKGD